MYRNMMDKKQIVMCCFWLRMH